MKRSARVIAKRTATVIALLGGLLLGGGSPAAEDDRFVLVGACYCRAAGELHCTADLSEGECRRRCDEGLCDRWFWLERRQCWNWGYGG